MEGSGSFVVMAFGGSMVQAFVRIRDTPSQRASDLSSLLFKILTAY